MIEFNRRSYLKTTGIATAGMVGLAGCSNIVAATGTSAKQATDQAGMSLTSGSS